MAENLNEYSSSVFTREDVSILPVLDTNNRGIHNNRGILNGRKPK